MKRYRLEQCEEKVYHHSLIVGSDGNFVSAEDYTALERRAQELEKRLREEWAFGHGCPMGCIYGDDGELHCNCCMLDFRRMDFDELSQRVMIARATKAGAVLKSAPPDAGGTR